MNPGTCGGFVIRDLKLGLQVVSKPPALLVRLGRAFYHHGPQKFKLDLTLSGGMSEIFHGVWAAQLSSIAFEKALFHLHGTESF